MKCINTIRYYAQSVTTEHGYQLSKSQTQDAEPTTMSGITVVGSFFIKRNGKYEIRTQKKKDAIIKASLELFRTKGYTNTSINEIAANTKVTAVSIYNYFQNKENLVRECASALIGETQEMVNALLHEEMILRIGCYVQ